MDVYPPSLDAAFHYIAYLIMADDAKRRNEVLPVWRLADDEIKEYYLKLARLRIDTWQATEANEL